MSLRLALASVYVPGFVKRRALRDLLERTAAAFAVPVPDTTGESYDRCLRAFAVFTTRQAEAVEAEAGGDGPGQAVRARLRAAALDLGGDVRRRLGVRTRAEAMRAARLVYRMLGIDFEGLADGRIVIRRCAFSALYSPSTCALVSGLDEGLLAGLAGEGRLEFGARITEGCDHCAATFHFQDGNGRP